MTTITVRYIVDDVDEAVTFYRDHLGFEVDMRPAPGFAMLRRGSLRLALNAPGAGGAGQPAADGRRPAPGGWNRFQIEVDDLDRVHAELAAAGCVFRNDITTGRGGRQVLVDDPSGNPVELFEPAAT